MGQAAETMVSRSATSRRGLAPWQGLLLAEPVAPPSIQATSTTVAEEDSVVLTCLTGDTGVSIQWVPNDQPLQLTDRMTLSLNSSVLTIDPVRREDAGQYQCEVFNSVSSRRSSIIRLEVKSEEKNPGVSAGTAAGIACGVLVGVAVAVALGCFLLLKRTGSHTTQRGERPPSGDKSWPRQHRATVPSSRPAVPICEELLNPDMNVYSQINHQADTTL